MTEKLLWMRVAYIFAVAALFYMALFGKTPTDRLTAAVLYVGVEVGETQRRMRPK